MLDQVAAGDSSQLATLVDEDALLIERALAVAELSALELLDEWANDPKGRRAALFREAASDAFYLARAVPLPPDTDEALKAFLRLVSFAVLGDRSADARRWLHEHPWPKPDSDAPWDARVFQFATDAFLRVVRKEGWQDLHQVAKAIGELRTLQTTFESSHLKDSGDCVDRAALELVSLYHFAKAVETLASYAAKGTPTSVVDELKFHYARSIRAAGAAAIFELEILLRWVRAACLQVAQNSVWWLLRSFNSQISQHVRNLAAEANDRPLLELLPPQRRALLDEGLLDPANRAVVVETPTSSGKTLLAEFRILQARNSFPKCWVAYLVPTRALVNQILLRLRRDLGPLGIQVESATPAIEIDVFEEELLVVADEVDVLVTTPEKLDLLVRSRQRGRPLGLVVLDEAHNLGEGERGLRAELLLSTLNRECPDAQFLLLTPFVPNASELATWLDEQRSKAIVALDWQPNDFTVAYAYATGQRRSWELRLRTLHTSRPGIELDEELVLSGTPSPLDIPVSKARSKSATAAAIAKSLSSRGTVILLAYSPRDTWSIGELLSKNMPDVDPPKDRIDLVQRFLATELGSDFQLSALLSKGIAVHHAGLPPDVRFLIEWLAEEGEIRVLVATTSLAQGVNFPVSSVVLATHQLYQPYAGRQAMAPAAFWNIAGRAGRIFQETLGLIVFASVDEEAKEIREFVGQNVTQLASTLEAMVEEVLQRGWDLNLASLVRSDRRWSSFVQYLAHAYRLAADHGKFIADTEKLLRGTLGYRRLAESRPVVAEQLVDSARAYAETLAKMGPGIVSLVDTTGFSGESILELLSRKEQIPSDPTAWVPGKLFSGSVNELQGIIGALLPVRELQFEAGGGAGGNEIATVISKWVLGRSIRNIAEDHFQDGGDITAAITECCRGLFQRLIQPAAWGLGAAQALASIDTATLSPEQVEEVRTLPAMVYYGVDTVPGVLMRSLSVPRSVAVPLGERFARETAGGTGPRLPRARIWLEQQPVATWEAVRRQAAAVSGADYRRVWRILAGLDR
ncbi:MAG: DEAD/DEAH box helicase [Deltaproteobacteria bacterium]|nr:DEAD/DEAH box helicase [Deltaproteobacteria bacterium]